MSNVSEHFLAYLRINLVKLSSEKNVSKNATSSECKRRKEIAFLSTFFSLARSRQLQKARGDNCVSQKLAQGVMSDSFLTFVYGRITHVCSTSTA